MKWLGAGVGVVVFVLCVIWAFTTAQDAENEMKSSQTAAQAVSQSKTVAPTKRGLGRFGGANTRVEKTEATPPDPSSDDRLVTPTGDDVAIVPAMRAETPAAQAVLQQNRVVKLVDELVEKAGTKPENADEVRQLLLDEAAAVAEARRTGATSVRVVRANTDKKVASVLSTQEYQVYQKLRRQRRLPPGVIAP